MYRTHNFLKEDGIFLLLLTFLPEIVTYLLINGNFIFHFLNSAVTYGKEHISISRIERECCNCHSEEHKTQSLKGL